MEAGNLLREYEISSEPELFGVFFCYLCRPSLREGYNHLRQRWDVATK